MLTEMSLGRYTQKSPVSAYRSIGKKATVVGVLGVLSAFIILSYYSVIGGWILKYIESYVVTFQAVDFNTYIASPVEPIIWHLVFMVLTCLFCYKGAKSIEKASKFMMPLLFIFIIIIVIRSVTLPALGKGWSLCSSRLPAVSVLVLLRLPWARCFTPSALQWGLP